jgi:starch synthase
VKILFVSSEVVPFAKTGGLADVAGALPLALKELGQEVVVIMPKYGNIDLEQYPKGPARFQLDNFKVPLGERVHRADLHSSYLPSKSFKVPILFLKNLEYFERDGFYVNPETNQDYLDNDERFIFFARGVLEALKRLNWKPDIIHCNDWQSGLIPAYLRTIYSDHSKLKNAKTVFTIHNLAYQGNFPFSSFEKTNLPPELFTMEGLEAWEQINFMKAGLVYSDVITTVSRKYSQEIRSSEELGCGLQGVIENRKDDLFGIVNGIDYDVWSPAKDSLIYKNFDFETLEIKLENKKALLKKVDLPFSKKVPVIGIISRLAAQKGFDLIGEIIDQMVELDLQLVVLGNGDHSYQEMFQRAAKKHPERVAVSQDFDDELAHWIEAGSDMFLMPSRYEPCGLNQLYSLKYGTVPIVRATGGLDDTIDDYFKNQEIATGFKFEEYDSLALLETIKSAIEVFKDQQKWKTLIENGMSKDFSWAASAQKYHDVYTNLTLER